MCHYTNDERGRVSSAVCEARLCQHCTQHSTTIAGVSVSSGPHRSHCHTSMRAERVASSGTVCSRLPMYCYAHWAACVANVYVCDVCSRGSGSLWDALNAAASQPWQWGDYSNHCECVRAECAEPMPGSQQCE